MTDTDEILAAYAEAAKPYWQGGGAITAKECSLRSWRYFLEINSACNLACPTCTKGNKEGYDHQTGVMEPDLMEKCIDKIKSENPDAIVFLYGNSEPFLHPRLVECIKSVKRRGLNCQLSTNLNFLRNEEQVKGVLESGLDFMIISLSGFTQEVYVKGPRRRAHRQGQGEHGDPRRPALQVRQQVSDLGQLPRVQRQSA